MENKTLGFKQYADANNLNARIYLNAKFSTNKYPWPRWIFDQFEKKENLKILELGCGTGLLWQINSQHIFASWDITLSDYSPGMVDEAAKNLADVSNHFCFMVINAEDITLPEKSFDVVIANNMLYHLPNREKAFRGIKRVLKENGVLYATTGGINNLSELKSLLTEFKKAPDFNPAIGDVVTGFSLENGKEQLAPFFNDIELIKYENSLEIIEADAIVNYFLSFNDMKAGTMLLEDHETESFQNYLLGKLKPGGKIVVSKDSGMFICKNN